MPDIHESTLTQLSFSSEINPVEPSPCLTNTNAIEPVLFNDLWARIISLTAPAPEQMMPVQFRQVSKSWLRLYDVCLKAKARQLNKDAVLPDQLEDYELVVAPQGDHKIENHKIYLSQLQGKIAYLLRTPEGEIVRVISDLEVPDDRPLSEMVLKEHEIAIWHLLSPYTQSQMAVKRQQAEVDYLLQHEQDILGKYRTPPAYMISDFTALKVPRRHDFYNYFSREKLIIKLNSEIIQGFIMAAMHRNQTELALTEQHLTRFPSELFHNPNYRDFWGKLTALTLQRNRLCQLPPEIWKLRNLEYLNVTENKLTWVSPQLGKLTKLTTLDLSQNGLQKISVELGKLSRLFELNLRWNQIEELPREIGNLQNLHTLLLQGNRLLSLPSELGNCHQLRKLDVQSNFLKTLPVEIAALPNVHLYLGYNRLRSLPEAFNKSSFGNIWGNSYSQKDMLADQQGAELDLTALEVVCSRCTIS